MMRVERVDDLFEVIDGLRLLDLGDDGDRATLFGHDLVHALTSSALRTNESAMRSAPSLQAPAQVVLVLLGQRGHVDRDAGQVDALVVRDGAGDDDLRS